MSDLKTNVDRKKIITSGKHEPKTERILQLCDVATPTKSRHSGQVLVNNGVPVSLNVGVTTGDWATQLASATANPGWDALRTTHSADIMLLFTGSLTGYWCGHAVQHNWTRISNQIPGQFVPEPSNPLLDLTGQDDSYYAIVATSGTCPDLLAAHEFAHLLGTGHTKEFALGDYLFDDSHAETVFTELDPLPEEPGGGPPIGTITYGQKTIAAEGGNPPACHDMDVSCTYDHRFSSNDGVADAEGTFEVTALSVANYRVPTQGCGLEPPENFAAALIASCNPPPYSQWVVTWTDGCPSATDYYEIWYQQPIINPPVFGWNSYIPASNVFITGAPSLIRAKACSNTGGCSSLSIHQVIVHDVCQ